MIMGKIDVSKSIRADRLILNDAIFDVILIKIFRLIVRGGPIFLLLGLLISFFSETGLGAGYQYIGAALTSILIACIELHRDSKLYKMEVDNFQEMKMQVKEHFSRRRWAIVTDRQDAFLAIEWDFRPHYHNYFYAIYRKGILHYCSVYELPFPLCAINARRDRKYIEMMVSKIGNKSIQPTGG